MREAVEFILILVALTVAAPIMWLSWKIFGPILIVAALVFALLKVFKN